MTGPATWEALGDVVTVPEAAAFLRVSAQTLRAEIRDAALPAFRLRGTWRIEKSALVEYVRGDKPAKRVG